MDRGRRGWRKMPCLREVTYDFEEFVGKAKGARYPVRVHLADYKVPHGVFLSGVIAAEVPVTVGETVVVLRYEEAFWFQTVGEQWENVKKQIAEVSGPKPEKADEILWVAREIPRLLIRKLKERGLDARIGRWECIGGED